MIFIILFAPLILLGIGFLYFLYRIYRVTFYSKQKTMPDVGNALSRDQHDMLKSTIKEHIEEYTTIPFETISTKSFDGLTLRGKYYKVPKSKHAVIIFHGYKSNISKDGSIITKYCLEHGYNVLVVNQRGHGDSEGRSITFGIKERFDCKSWVDHITELLGDDCKILLFGISMGGATVMMASSLNMPTVKGIISDCGFSSPKEILRSVLDSKGAPTDRVYPFLRMSARIFAGFDPDETSATEELRKSEIPITIIHSDGDRFVPCDMGKRCFESSNAAIKKLVIIKEAGHALSFFFNKKAYLSAIEEMISIIS